MRSIFAAFAVLVITLGCKPPDKTTSASGGPKLEGIWICGEITVTGNGQTKHIPDAYIQFLPNNTFVAKMAMGTIQTDSEGSYSLEGDKMNVKLSKWQQKYGDAAAQASVDKLSKDLGGDSLWKKPFTVQLVRNADGSFNTKSVDGLPMWPFSDQTTFTKTDKIPPPVTNFGA